MHERAEIRQAVTAALIGKTSAGSRVLRSRTLPLRSVLPALIVFSTAEPSELVGTAPLELQRTASILVQGFVQVPGPEVADDLADALALEIETALDAMAADPALNTAFSEATLVNTDVDFSSEGERPLAAVSLTYEFTYFTTPRLSSAVDKFDVAEITTKLDADTAPAVHLVSDINQE